MKFLKIFKFKISEMSIPGAIILSGLIVGISIFITTWFFFGGSNNKTKLFLDNPPRINAPQNTLTPQQIQMLQQAQQQRLQQGTSTTNVVPPAPVPTPVPKPKAK